MECSVFTSGKSKFHSGCHTFYCLYLVTKRISTLHFAGVWHQQCIHIRCCCASPLLSSSSPLPHSCNAVRCRSPSHLHACAPRIACQCPSIKSSHQLLTPKQFSFRSHVAPRRAQSNHYPDICYRPPSSSLRRQEHAGVMPRLHRQERHLPLATGH